MFKIKETVARITPDLIAKNRAPISLAMGAPTQAPPKFVIEALKKALDLAKTLNLDINVKVEDLSYPELKKLGFILTISHSPKIIALDEPFKGLEYKDKIKLMDLMRKEGKDGNIVIIASSSLKDPREIARKIALIKKGVIIDIGYTHKLNIKNHHLSK